MRMSQSERFQIGIRVLAVLASQPEAMHTSESIARELKKNPVVVRRAFPPLHKAGLIMQRKGPHGGAKLMVPPKKIRIGDVFEATARELISVDDKALDGLMKKVRAHAVNAMNAHSLTEVVKMQK